MYSKPRRQGKREKALFRTNPRDYYDEGLTNKEKKIFLNFPELQLSVNLSVLLSSYKEFRNITGNFKPSRKRHVPFLRHMFTITTPPKTECKAAKAGKYSNIYVIIVVGEETITENIS